MDQLIFVYNSQGMIYSVVGVANKYEHDFITREERKYQGTVSEISEFSYLGG